MTIEPRQDWHLAISKLPKLEQQYADRIHQALEKAVPYFIQHVQPPKNQRQYRQLMDVLERWHEQGVQDDPPQKSPPPGWLLLQAAIMEDDHPWMNWMVGDTQAVHQLACSDIMSSTMQFTRDNNLPLHPRAMSALWEASLSFPVAADQAEARAQLVRVARWFHAAELNEQDLDDHTQDFLKRLSQAADYPGQDVRGVSSHRTDTLSLLTLLRRNGLADQVDQSIPRHTLRKSSL